MRCRPLTAGRCSPLQRPATQKANPHVLGENMGAVLGQKTVELPTYHLITLHDPLRREMGFGVDAGTSKTTPSGKGRAASCR